MTVERLSLGIGEDSAFSRKAEAAHSGLLSRPFPSANIYALSFLS